MNKITKVGLSALCGSLACVSAANAGTLEVLGTAEATWTSKALAVTGNPIGMNTGLTFKGSGELDGGQTFSVSLVDTDQAAWSSANITLNTNSVGKFVLSSAEGGQGIGGYDDNMPTAWEEVWDTAVATNANFQKGVGSSTNISWTSPKALGSTLQIAYAPDNDGVQNNNKSVSGSASDYFGGGWDIVLDIDPQFDAGGVNLFIGASETKVAKGSITLAGEQGKNLRSEHNEAVVGLEFTFGPLQVGGQVSAERMQTQLANTPNYYANSSWGVAFNVSDDLSVSYSEARHVQSNTKKASNIKKTGWATPTILNEYNPKSWMNGESVQVSYTMGGVSIKYSDTVYDNTGYSFDTKVPAEAKVVSVGLAF